MRTIFLLAALLFVPLAGAQPFVTVTLIAEQAQGFAQPHDAALSPDGKLLYVTDMANSRVVVLEAMTLKNLGSFGKGALAYPHDAEFDAVGRLLVADTGNDRVAIYKVDGARAELVGELKGLDGPKYLSIGKDRIWLADEYNYRLLMLDRTHRLLGVLGSGRQGRGPNAFYKPEAVVTRAPYLWVIDTYNDRVVLLRTE